MLGCIEAGGKAVGILADGLLRAVTSTKYRNAIATDQLALVSPFNPEAGFNVGNAMARNKYIYCCADAAVVVASGKNKGGTWNGAVEAMRAEWIPIWIRRTADSPDGNAALIRRGAYDLGDQVHGPGDLTAAAARRDVQGGLLFGEATSTSDHPVVDLPEHAQSPARVRSTTGDAMAGLSFVEFFVASLARAEGSAALPADVIARTLGVTKAQVQAWLKEATKLGLVVKSTRPVRYQVAPEALERLASRRRRA